MGKIKREDLDKAIELYEDKFSGILEEYEELSKKSNSYLEIMDKKISELASYDVTTRGTQQHLAEHMANAVSLISHCQSIADSKFKLKKQIVDYAVRDLSGDDEEKSEADMTKIVGDLIEAQKKTQEKLENKFEKIVSNTSTIDDEIAKILSEQEDN